jgi:N-acetylmuramoyl-L-alanine amidase
MSMTTSVNLTNRCYSGRSGHSITLIGIHTMEAPEAGSTAENVANYFKTVDASAHWCVDNNSRVRCVNDRDGAWTMPPTNLYSLNVEMAGYASQTPAQWHDAYSVAVLDNVAVCVSEWCRLYAIPVRRLTAGQLDAGQKGIAGHWDVNNAFHQSDHSDPGSNFPWTEFLNLVSKKLGQPQAPPSGKPSCTAFQRAVRTDADNQWGPDTDKHATALIQATSYGGTRYPYGVKYTQQVVGTAQDGIWGPNSRAALIATVKTAQSALTSMGFDPHGVDGIWGPNTNGAFLAARTACHI